MSRLTPPPLGGLSRQLKRTRGSRGVGRDASRMAGSAGDSFVRETFILPRDAARSKAREWLERYPKAAYWTSVESWRALPEGDIEFTMRRLPSAD